MPDLLTRLAAAPDRAQQATSDFDLNDGPRPTGRSLTPAAVLIGVDADQRLVLTQRSARLKHHPGQIAFPGGRRDPGDTDAVATALREAREEIGLPASAVRLIGTLPAHQTVTGYHVTPVLARLDSFTERAEPGEVAEIFRVPLAHVTDLARFRVESRLWRGAPRYYYTVPWGPYYIWGATARMLRALAEAMR